MEHGKQAHNFDRLRVLKSDHLEEKLGPFELLQLTSSEEALFNDVKVYESER